MLGTYEAIDVILFVLVIGGFIGVFQKTGAFDAGLNALVLRLRGREAWLIVIVTTLISLGGTTFGMAEETLAFYPLLVPVFIAAGYDAMVAVAVIFIGTSVGTMASIRLRSSSPRMRRVFHGRAGFLVARSCGRWRPGSALHTFCVTRER